MSRMSCGGQKRTCKKWKFTHNVLVRKQGEVWRPAEGHTSTTSFSVAPPVPDDEDSDTAGGVDADKAHSPCFTPMCRMSCGGRKRTSKLKFHWPLSFGRRTIFSGRLREGHWRSKRLDDGLPSRNDKRYSLTCWIARTAAKTKSSNSTYLSCFE